MASDVRFFGFLMRSRFHNSVLLFTICLYWLSTPKAFAGFNDPMTFYRATSGGNCETCQWIAAEGVIMADTYKKYLQFLQREKLSQTKGLNIHLNSPGGDLIGGVRLGIAIRNSKANTVVSGSSTDSVWEEKKRKISADQVVKSECSSACVFAFIGGVSRYASRTTPKYKIGFQDIGRLGVHQFYDKISLAAPNTPTLTARDRIKDQQVMAVLLGYISEIGVSAELLQLAGGTHPKNMHYLIESELLRTRVDNQMVQKVFIRGYRNGVGIVEIKFSRQDADYRLEFYCDRRKLMMMAAIDWRGSYDVTGHKEWNLFDGISLSGGSQVLLISEKFNKRLDGGTSGKLRFRFQDPLSQLIQRKKFQFEDFSSRYASNKARDLSFILPSNFDGLYILPKVCFSLATPRRSKP